MSYGVIEYDTEGRPTCEICGKSFHRLMSHVRQKHEMNEKEYKLQFGLDLHKGICSKESADIARQRVYENYDKCIGKNLLIKGEGTRFLKGSEGRTADKVSEQSKIMLRKNSERLKKRWNGN